MPNTKVLMSLPSLKIAVWRRPHRAHGSFVEIDTDEVSDGLPGGVMQSFKDVPPMQREPELQPQFPYIEFSVPPGTAVALAGLADRIAYSFAEHAFTPMLGGSSFGLRVSRGYQQVTVVWRGRFEDQHPSIRELYEAVEALAVV